MNGELMTSLPLQELLRNAPSAGDIAERFSLLLEPLKKRVVREPAGCLSFPYLIPSGFYQQMWDWDGFFMGCHFAHQGQADKLKHWVLNFLDHVEDDGHVSGCITPEGPREIMGRFSAKPFLSQGAWIASKAEGGDVSWLKDQYQGLCRVLNYRIHNQRDEESGLYFWMNAMQSGADNNPALNYDGEDPRSYLACDISAYQVRELEAQSLIAGALGLESEAAEWKESAEQLRSAILDKLWCPEDQAFYNIDRETGQLYRRMSYSSFVPLFAKLAPEEDGRAMIKRYLLTEEHMKSPFGFRSLSRSDPDYNNENIIIPFSNWQGPVWPIANYLYSVALHHYGFEAENEWLAVVQGILLADDIEKYGTMHENYDAETGAPLAPSHDHRTPEGDIVGFVSWNLCIENLLEGVVNDRWMLLDL
ncbi:trehalase family glycosidase [Roseibacillus persicicus]|uniref:MGH1-like glycoside hydrolase domain-containing protein n=1 Tax=Roseibacillus persicicus TaxID=454148 RepID=UPI00398BA37E